MFIKKDNFLNSLTVALFAGPVLLDLAIHGWKRCFFYFAADAFYYFSVAQNYAAQGFFTFDQQFPTNGFHPLWQVLLGGLFRVAKALSLSPQVVLPSIIIICVALISAAIWLLGKCFINKTNRLPVAFLLLPVGIHGLLVSLIYDRYGSLYSYANGMESAMVIFLYAVTMRFIVRSDFLKTRSSTILTSLLLSLLFLARLDHILFAAALILFVAMESIISKDRNKLIASLSAAAGCAVVLIAFFLVNMYTVGMLLPVSGSLKSSFPSPDLKKIPESLHLISIFLTQLVHLNLSFSFIYKEMAYRHAQILLPMFAAIGFLTHYVIRSRRAFHPLEKIDLGLAATAVFILFLGSYNYFYVPLWNQGHWYFPVSVLFISLLFVRVFQVMGSGLSIRFPGWFKNRATSLTLMVGGIILAVFSLFLDFIGMGEKTGIGDKQFLGALLGMSLFLVGCLGFWQRSMKKRLLMQKIEKGGRGTISVTAIIALFVLCFFQFVYRNDIYNQPYVDFFDHVSSIREYYTKRNEKPKLIEYDDGIIAYSTGYPAIAGLGFALDKQGAEYKRWNRLLFLAYQRGYNRITSLIYFQTFDLSTISYATPSDVLKSRLGKLFFLSSQEVEPFTFWVDYLSKDPPFIIIGMELAKK